MLPDLVWNAAALEGNTFTLPEVRTLLDGVTVGGHPIEDERQVFALVDGYTHLDALVASQGFVLSKVVSDDLHGRVAVHEAIEQDELEARFASICAFVGALEDPRERALAYFAAATRSQFYFDGNKRTARLMMTGLLMSEGYDAVSIPFVRQFEFNQALDVLFTRDDATPLMAFVADCAAS